MAVVTIRSATLQDRTTGLEHTMMGHGMGHNSGKAGNTSRQRISRMKNAATTGCTLETSCTLHSPPFSDRFWRTFTGPSQFRWTQQTVRWTSNGIRRTWPNSTACPVQVRSKSSEVILKQKSIGLARLASPADFCWTSVGLLLDFWWF